MNDTSYEIVLADIVAALQAARSTAARSVNAIMTATYWQIGHRIVEYEQQGHERAPYGQALLERLATDLTTRFGRGFSARNLYQMRQFRLVWTPKRILQTASAKSGSSVIEAGQTTALEQFPLPWSAYVRLLSVADPRARDFYEVEALRNGWTVRQLDRQVSSQFYERTALSRDRAAMLAGGAESTSGDALTAEQEIKDPLVLEFLGLKDEYSETDLEDGLITHLADFLLELGDGFAFTYQDAGQMHLYLNYARQNWTMPGENPPVGLILCAQKGADEARYALDGLTNVLAAEYRIALPDESLLAEELARTRAALERAASPNDSEFSVGASTGG